MTVTQDRDSTTTDVIVIGAGPAGATTAAKLAQAGRSVLLLERRTHPRFHIGESMLPTMNVVAEKIGVWDRITKQSYVPKYGAEYSGYKSEKFGRAALDAQGPGRHHVTYQVERARFDKLLAEFAEESGARLIQNASVLSLVQEGGRVVGVSYEHDGQVRTALAEYVVDAGGRASKVSQSFGLRSYIERMRMVAVFGHFENMQEKYNPGAEGDIMIGGHPDGWLWAIPLQPDVISVGSVMRRDVFASGDPAHLLAKHVDTVRRISKRVTGTVLRGDLRVESDYCYFSDTITGPGWFMVGDAACFFDPIFSAGTFLAMATGLRAAETLDAILAKPERADELAAGYSSFYKTGYDLYARMIYAYYDGGYNLRPYLASITDDLGPGNWFTNKWVIRQLAGDFWNDENPLNRALLRKTEWDTFAPFERAWGDPFYPDAQA